MIDFSKHDAAIIARCDVMREIQRLIDDAHLPDYHYLGLLSLLSDLESAYTNEVETSMDIVRQSFANKEADAQ